jgi:predicted secreted protein
MREYGKNATCIQVRIGERFMLALPALATGGFTWLMDREPEVAVLTQERIRPGGPGIGASSVQEFEFAGMHAGVSTLVLQYKRPWENVKGERLEIKIVVEP